MKQVFLFSTIAFAGVAICATTASAQTISAWDLFQTPGDQVTQPATATATNVTGLDMTRNGGLVGVAANNSFNSSGWATNAEGTPTVVNPAAYVEIGFVVDAGFEADLDSLIIGTRSSGSGPRTIGAYSSLDGFTTPFFTFTQDGTNFLNSIVDLSSFQDVTGTFTIRFMNDGGADTADPTRAGEMDIDSTWRIVDHFDAGVFTDTQITGVVSAVPEPTSLGLLAIGGLTLLRRRR